MPLFPISKILIPDLEYFRVKRQWMISTQTALPNGQRLVVQRTAPRQILVDNPGQIGQGAQRFCEFKLIA